MLKNALELGSYFKQLEWLLLWAPKDRVFITTDNPFHLPPSGVEITDPGVIKVIPLTAKTCLLMGNIGTKLDAHLADPKRIRDINLASAVNGKRFLISSVKPILDKIIRITGVNNYVKEIRNDALNECDIPMSDANWDEVSKFAQSFKGYEYWDSLEEHAVKILKRGLKVYDEKRQLHIELSLTELRTCLFFHQQHLQYENLVPDDQEINYIHALVEAIHEKVCNYALQK
jgi:hypothetical protein